jgi:hypothetical protein
MLVGTILGDLDDLPTNFQIAKGIVRIAKRQGDPRIPAHVAVLAAALCGVDAHVGAVEIAPHRCRLGAAVGHQSGQVGKSLPIQNVAVGLRYWLSHDC